jgi:hypothetical protein
MKDSIFIWHHFEQQEAGCLHKVLTKSTRKRCFVELTKIVDVAVGHGLCNKETLEWMQNRLDELVESHPELIPNED